MEQYEKVAAIEAHRDMLLERQNALLNELSFVERQIDDVVHILGRMGVMSVNTDEEHRPALYVIKGGKA